MFDKPVGWKPAVVAGGPGPWTVGPTSKLPTIHEVLRTQRWRLPDEAARKRRLNQKDLKSATVQVAPVILVARPEAHLNWSEFGLTFLITGAAWMVGDLRSF